MSRAQDVHADDEIRTEKTHMKTVSILLVIMALFGVMQIALSWNKSELNYEDEPERFVLEQLTKHRVVLLGDYTEGSIVSQQTVVQILDVWAGALDSNEKAPETLALVPGNPDTNDLIKTSFITTGRLPNLVCLSPKPTSKTSDERPSANAILESLKQHPQRPVLVAFTTNALLGMLKQTLGPDQVRVVSSHSTD